MARRTPRWLSAIALCALLAVAWQRLRADLLSSRHIPRAQSTAGSAENEGKAAAAAYREPVDGACPVGYPIKANPSGIYHVPGGRSYQRSNPERCYADPESAEADGYRRAKA